MSSPDRRGQRTPQTGWRALKAIVCAGAAVFFLLGIVSYALEAKLHDWDDPDAVTLERMRSVAAALCAYEREHDALPRPDTPPVEIFGPTLVTGHGEGAAPDPGFQLEDAFGHQMVMKAIDGGIAIVAQPPSHRIVRVLARPRCHIVE